MLTRRLIAPLLAAVALALLPASAHATAIISIQNSTILFSGDEFDNDQVAAYETPTSIRITKYGAAQIGEGAGCIFVQGDINSVDCVKAGLTRIVFDLNNGNDVASVSPSITIPVIFNGGEGNDGLFGGGGDDIFDGGAGDDNIVARDGRAEPIDCGIGNDTAISDDADNRTSCEEIEGDADSDGVRRPADCDDTNPTIRPGATDVPDNGVDEDCSGVDSINTDRDGDGVPRPQDCDDTNAAIRPGIREVRGNDIDENCDTRIPPFPPLSGSVSGTWAGVGNRTRNLTLLAKDFPKGTVVTLRCLRSPACPDRAVTRRVKRKGATLDLHATLGRRTFGSGARIELRISRTLRIGRLLRYRITKPGAPDVAFLCAPPGVRAGPC